MAIASSKRHLQVVQRRRLAAFVRPAAEATTQVCEHARFMVTSSFLPPLTGRARQPSARLSEGRFARAAAVGMAEKQPFVGKTAPLSCW
jgi:hypothetical protein